MGSGQTYFEDTYGMSWEDWKFHCKGKDEANTPALAPCKVIEQLIDNDNQRTK